MGWGKIVWTGTDTSNLLHFNFSGYIRTGVFISEVFRRFNWTTRQASADSYLITESIEGYRVQLDVNMSGLRQTPLTCSGHTRPVVQLAFSDVTPFGYFLISACKGRFGEISGRLFQFLKQYGRQFCEFPQTWFPFTLVLHFFVSYYSTCFHYIFKTRAYIFCSEYDFYTDG